MRFQVTHSQPLKNKRTINKTFFISHCSILGSLDLPPTKSDLYLFKSPICYLLSRLFSLSFLLLDSGVLTTLALLIMSLKAFLKTSFLLYLFWLSLSHSCVDSFVYIGLRFKHLALQIPGKHSTTVVHAHISQPPCSPLSSTSFSSCLLHRLSQTLIILLLK